MAAVQDPRGEVRPQPSPLQEEEEEEEEEVGKGPGGGINSDSVPASAAGAGGGEETADGERGPGKGERGRAAKRQLQQRKRQDRPTSAAVAESTVNLALIYPDRFGWTAWGGIADLATPHQRARQPAAQRAYLRLQAEADRLRARETAAREAETAAAQRAEAAARQRSGVVAAALALAQEQQRAGGERERSTSPVEAAASVAPIASRDPAIVPSATATPAAHAAAMNEPEKQQPQPQRGGGALRTEDVLLGQNRQQPPGRPEPSPGTAGKSPAGIICGAAAAEDKRSAHVTLAPSAPSGPLGSGAILASISDRSGEQRMAATGQGLGNLSSGNQPPPPPIPKKLHEVTSTKEEKKIGRRKAKKGTSNQETVLHLRGTDSHGTLDIHAYHRGRAGFEPRDPRTGKLLCDLPPSDTGEIFAMMEGRERRNKKRMGNLVARAGHISKDKGGTDRQFDYADDGDLTLKIKICFPLCDVDDMENFGHKKAANSTAGSEKTNAATEERSADDGTVSVGASNGPLSSSEILSQSKLSPTTSTRSRLDIPQFRDTVEWDLSSPRAPTSMSYATSVASDFGLSMEQMLDLAASIEKQIDDFFRKKNLIRPLPTTRKDPFGIERLPASTVALMPRLYGGPHGAGGVVNMTNQYKNAILSHSRSSGRSSKVSSKGERPRVTGKSNVMPSNKLPSHETQGDFSVEADFRNAVIRQAKADFRVSAVEKAADGGKGKLRPVQFVRDQVCHICHHRKETGIRFACDKRNNHVYCDYHCSTRLGFSVSDAMDGEKVLDFCPVCCLTCVCSRCIRKLDASATNLKNQCKKAGVGIDDLFNSEVGSGILKLNAGGKKKVRTDPAPQPVTARARKRESKHESKHDEDLDYLSMKNDRGASRVKRASKPPPSEFPVEVCGGYDLDPSLEEDYHTIFDVDGSSHLLKEGPRPRMKFDEVCDPNPSGVAEDGSVDHCMQCLKGGVLICCDRCPRSFHEECLPDGLTEKDIPDDNWECHLCIRDSNPQPNNEITGESSLPLIIAAFADASHCHGLTEKMLVLAKVHEMVLFLATFDFGYIFKDPVDLKEVRDYFKFVEKPMDLTTIHCNLINHRYSVEIKQRMIKKSIPAVQAEERLLSGVALAALKDLELIWHNCFTYNVIGSAIYRMGEVQRRKSRMIIKTSIEQHLDPDDLGDLEDYIFELSRKRDPLAKRLGKSKSMRVRANVCHKIEVPFTSAVNRTGRIVAVFDPERSMIVKQYTNLRVAVKAAILLSNLGYASEFAVTEWGVKNLVRKSSNDQSLLLFKYRWMYLDDLRSGRVILSPAKIRDENLPGNRFEEATCVRSNEGKAGCEDKPGFKKDANNMAKEKNDVFVIERISSDRKCTYDSVEAAYSSLERDKRFKKEMIVSLTTFKQALSSVDLGKEIITMGSTWRQIRLPTETKKTGGKTGTVRLGAKEVLSLGGAARFFRQDGVEPVMSEEVVIVKTDLVTRKAAEGFESIESAFRDWVVTRKASSHPSDFDAYDMHTFEAYYVDGDKNIDCVQWKRVFPADKGVVADADQLNSRKTGYTLDLIADCKKRTRDDAKMEVDCEMEVERDTKKRAVGES